MTSKFIEAIIVSYSPDLSTLIPNLQSLCSVKSLRVSLWLNAASEDDVAQINCFINRSGLNISFSASPLNVGLSSPYNVISKRCVQNLDCLGVLFLDQDSCFDSDFLFSFLERFYSSIKVFPVGVYAGYPVDPRLSKPYRIQSNSFHATNLFHNQISTQGACSSMSIVSREAFLRCGFFDNRFFIDLIDYEFCLRVTSSRLLIIVDKDFEFNHPIGVSSISLPFNSTQPISAPFRHYYQIRNLFFFPTLSFAGAIRFPYEFFKRSLLILIISFYTRDSSRLSYFFKGVFHGILLKGGPLR